MVSLVCILMSALLFAPADSISVPVSDATSLIRPDYRDFARNLSISTACLPTSGNEFRIITAGSDFGDALYRDFRDATRLIEMELFLFGDDSDGREARQLLFDKVKEGVEVRYTHDSFGNFFDSIFDGRPVFKGFYTQMVKGGINLRDFSTLLALHRTFSTPGQRQHRKIIIMDEQIAYTGGMNITEGSISGWNDCMMRITGPAVKCLRDIWSLNWNDAPGLFRKKVRVGLERSGESPSPEGKVLQVVPDGPDIKAHTAEDAMIWLLENAKDYVWFQTPYFIPTGRLLKALKAAAERGLDVRVIIPLEGDLPAVEPSMRSYYKTCLESGVKLFLRNPPFVHSKNFLCDDYLVCVGSTNLDKLSLKRNYEVNVFIYDDQTAAECKAVFQHALSDSQPVTPALFDTWSGKEKFNQVLLRAASPWL